MDQSNPYWSLPLEAMVFYTGAPEPLTFKANASFALTVNSLGMIKDSLGAFKLGIWYITDLASFVPHQFNLTVQSTVAEVD